MPAHVLSPDEHSLLVEAFRKAPGNVNRAATATGVGWATAKRYWEKGQPACSDIRAKPISEIIAEEQELARARLLELQATTEQLAAELEAKRRLETNTKAMKDATDARVQEGQVIRMARGAASALLANLTALAKGSARVGVRVGAQLERVAQEQGDMTKADMLDYTRIMATLAGSLRQANDAAKQAMEMERLLLGEPTAITAHVHLGDVSVDEAERRIAAGLRALQRAKDKGLVVEGKIVPHHAGLTTGAPQQKPAPVTADPDAPLTH